MEICIDKVYDRITLIKNIRPIVSWDLRKIKNKVDDIDQGIKLTIDVPDEHLIMFKTICDFTAESKRYNMEKHQFKPFDQVLVRDDEKCNWKIGIYSHYEENDSIPHVCAGSKYRQCIPYNENTAHLIGTTKPYEPPKPKTYRVKWPELNGLHVEEYTDEEFENFIKVAVLNNKDIQYFEVSNICG